MQAYARISNPCQRDWALAATTLLRCRAAVSAHSPTYLRGWLAALELGERRISCLHMQSPVTLHCVNPTFHSLLICRSGALHLQLGAGSPVCLQPEQSLALAPGQSVQLVIPQQAGLVWLQWDAAGPAHGLVLRSEALAAETEAFLMALRYAADHDQATLRAERFMGFLETGGPSPAERVADVTDRRLTRVLALLEQQSHGDFDLDALARDAAMSERNLFYLMKSSLGMTPYRCYQRLRLIRARRGLVDCLAEHVGVSWHAANQGFSHLGRFAAVYRTHFGELPSETLAWLTQLRESTHLLGCSSGDGGLRTVSKNRGRCGVAPVQCE